MKSKNVRKISKVDETERIKLYKTHRGWCSSLSHFWTFLKADSIDEDDETSYEDYLKAIATIGTIAGGNHAAANNGNGRQYAIAADVGFAQLNGTWSFIKYSKRVG